MAGAVPAGAREVAPERAAPAALPLQTPWAGRAPLWAKDALPADARLQLPCSARDPLWAKPALLAPDGGRAAIAPVWLAPLHQCVPAPVRANEEPACVPVRLDWATEPLGRAGAP